MPKQTINIGTTANDRTGDKLRVAFDKVNDNFTELYDAAPATPVAAAAIDLTKRVHALNGAAYTLANGSEGQILYFVPVTGSTAVGNTVTVANGRYFDAGTSVVGTALTFSPFAGSAGVVTMIFTQGAWNASSGTWD